MGRLILGAVLVGAAAGCAVGPGYRRPELGVPAQWRRTDPAADSLRPFYDSLMANRDTLPLNPNGPEASADSSARDGVFLTDTTANLVWFDLLRDPELRKLVETALRENRDVRVASATIDEFRAQYGVAKGDFFPQVTLNAQGGRIKSPIANPGALGTFSYNQLQATANLSWELDFWGRIRRSTEAARNDLLAQRENQRAVLLTLVGDVANSYLLLRQLDLALEISQRTLAANRETFRLARRRFDQGLISELDVRQFESEVASPAVSVALLEGQITQTENQLSLLVGSNPRSIPRGRPLTEVLGDLTVPSVIPSALLERRPDVRQAEASLHAATARIGAAKGDLFPKFMVTGDYGTFSSNADDLFKQKNEIYQILGGVSMPIFTGGKVGKRVAVARARAEQSRYSYEQTVLTALREVEDALAGVRASRNQVAAQQTQVDALRRALRLAELRYQSGASSYLDLLDAQRSLFGAELSLAQVEGQQATAAVTLYRALGGGWPVAPADSAAPR
ncbi:MAG TPA: efflux transporter outer membrane subunit [Gemmatimonadales bacterium]|nr:efflux transporter outer membrane subunit [Gemmatimonadales bacterium]